MFQVGVDVGDSFADLVVVEEETGVVGVAKVPTTPDNLAPGRLQFQGQSYVLRIRRERALQVDATKAAFLTAHRARFQSRLSGITLRLVSLRTAAPGQRRPIDLNALGQPARPVSNLAEADVGRRSVWFDGVWRETPIYDRAQLAPGLSFAGPAILEQLDSTTVVEPGARGMVDQAGNVVLQV